jgi:hypothetical protein
MAEKMDVRVRDRYVRKGGLSRDEVKKQLQALPDLADRADWKDYTAEFTRELEESRQSGSDDRS